MVIALITMTIVKATIIAMEIAIIIIMLRDLIIVKVMIIVMDQDMIIVMDKDMIIATAKEIIIKVIVMEMNILMEVLNLKMGHILMDQVANIVIKEMDHNNLIKVNISMVMDIIMEDIVMIRKFLLKIR